MAWFGKAVRSTERIAGRTAREGSQRVVMNLGRSSSMTSGGMAKYAAGFARGPAINPGGGVFHQVASAARAQAGRDRALGMGAAIGASRRPLPKTGKSWLRRNPGKAMGAAGLGLGAASLARNQGPGATGNGYMPTGSSSGGRRF